MLQVLKSLSNIWQYETEDKLVGLKTILHLCCDNFSFITSKNLTLNAIQVIACIKTGNSLKIIMFYKKLNNSNYKSFVLFLVF